MTVVDGDVREVAASLDAVAAGIDLSAPACLLMGFLLHFFEPDAARDLVARYVAALAPGSYVVLSVGRADAEAAKAGFSTYSSGAGAGVQPLGAGLRQLLRRPGAGAAGRGRRPGVAPGLGAGRAPPGLVTARRSWASAASPRPTASQARS